MYCMGNPKHKSPQDILHLYFDDEMEDDEEEIPGLTPEECAELQAEMDAINTAVSNP